MSLFKGENTSVGVLQFEPEPTPLGSAVRDGAVWYDVNLNQLRTFVNGVSTPLGSGGGGGTPGGSNTQLQYNNAGTFAGTLGLVWNNATNTLTAGAGGIFSPVFASSSANTASAGQIRLASSDVISFRNAANNANFSLFSTGPANANLPADLITTAGGFAAPLFAVNQSTVASSGVFRIRSADQFCWRNNANNGDVCFQKFGASSGTIPADVFDFATLGQGLVSDFFGDGNAAQASTGQIRLASGSTFCWRNNAGTADVCFSKNASDVVQLNGTSVMLTTTPITLAQTPLTTNGDVLTVTAGVLARLGLGANGTFLGVSAGVLGYFTPTGSGTVNSSTQFALPYYSAAGTGTTLSGIAGPISPNGVPQYIVEIPSSGAASAPQFLLPGVTLRAVTAVSDTIVVTDRANYITYNNVGAVAVTLPQAGSTGFSNNFVFGTKNLGAGAVTITPTTSTIDGASTLVLNQGDTCTIYSDNVNYFSRCTSPLNAVTAPLALARTAGASTFSITGAAGQVLAGASPAFTATPTLGVAGATLGTLALAGNTSGTVTVRPQAAAGTWTLQLPTTAGSANQFLQTDGTGITTWAAGGGGGSTAWNAITNPAGNLTLTMGTNLSEWDYATAVTDAWKITNNTAATVTTPQSSPTIKPVCGQEWTGAGASTEGCLRLQYVPGTGLNAQSTIHYDNTSSSTNTNLGHIFSGKVYTATSSGAYNVNVQGSRVTAVDVSGVQTGSGTRGFYFSNAANIDAGGIDAGFTRVAAGLLGISNGSAGDSSGILLSGNKVFVTANFTTAANTNLQTITGLSWTLPAIAKNYSFSCHLAYSQGTANAAVAFGVQAATNAPNNIFARGIIYTSTSALTTGVLATLNTTTATAVVSATPSATATNFVADLSGTLENSANANTFNIMVSTATAADAVTILRGSYCTLS